MNVSHLQSLRDMLQFSQQYKLRFNELNLSVIRHTQGNLFDILSKVYCFTDYSILQSNLEVLLIELNPTFSTMSSQLHLLQTAINNLSKLQILKFEMRYNSTLQDLTKFLQAFVMQNCITGNSKKNCNYAVIFTTSQYILRNVNTSSDIEQSWSDFVAALQEVIIGLRRQLIVHAGISAKNEKKFIYGFTI